MKIINTGDAQVKPPIVMLIYGEGGVGKTTFISTAPKPLLADCENGSKYFGLRGIKLDVAQVTKWGDMKDFLEVANTDQYETLAIDPIGELMDKLKRYMIALGDSKLVQKDGSPTMAGWGWLKKTLRDYIKAIRDSGKHLILVAPLNETEDEGRIIKRPLVETKLWVDLVNMVEVVGYMTVVNTPEEGERRVIIVDPSSDRYTAKDRTGQLGRCIPPNFSQIVEACQGTKSFAWSKAKPEANAEGPKEDTTEEAAEDAPDKSKKVGKSKTAAAAKSKLAAANAA